MKDNRPKILYLCDCPNWAFHNRAKKISALLLQYKFELFFFTEHQEDRTEALRKAEAEAQIIVCDFFPWLPLLTERKKVIVGLRSFRCFEIFEQLYGESNNVCKKRT